MYVHIYNMFDIYDSLEDKNFLGNWGKLKVT